MLGLFIVPKSSLNLKYHVPRKTFMSMLIKDHYYTPTEGSQVQVFVSWFSLLRYKNKPDKCLLKDKLRIYQFVWSKQCYLDMVKKLASLFWFLIYGHIGWFPRFWSSPVSYSQLSSILILMASPINFGIFRLWGQLNLYFQHNKLSPSPSCYWLILTFNYFPSIFTLSLLCSKL